MKVALVVPRTQRRFSDICVPSNLLYIAAYLRSKIPSVEIRIFDGSIDYSPIGYDLDGEIFRFCPDVVGVTATTPQILSAYRLGDVLKRNLPDILTVIGGVHASALPEEAKQHFDVIVTGEGEKAFACIVADCANFKAKAPIIVEGEAISDLDTLPFPAYDLIYLPAYLNTSSNSFQNMLMNEPIMQLVTSRGCVGRCPFCYNSVLKPKLRFFSVKRVVEELQFLHEKYGVNNFFFHDDEFLANKSRLRELFDLAKTRGVDRWLRFVCQARVQSLNDVSFLKNLKASGCMGILVGFESHNQRVLNYLKTNSTTLKDQKDAVRNANLAGLIVYGSFIFGAPTETLREMWDTLFWALTAKISKVGFGLLVPYPGSKVYQYAVKIGLLDKLNYDLMLPSGRLFSYTVLVNSTVTRWQLKQFLRLVRVLLRVKTLVVSFRSLGSTFRPFKVSRKVAYS